MEFKVKNIVYAVGGTVIAYGLYRSFKKNLSNLDYQIAAMQLGCSASAIKAVGMIESNGDGFTSTGLVKTRLESQFLARYQNASGEPAKSFLTFASAYAYDQSSAILSTSFGEFQIMGFNYKVAGYSSPESYYRAVKSSAVSQLNSFVGFCKANKLGQYLKDKNWAAFAYRYNGPGYKANSYDTKLAYWYNKFEN
jgi:hypothetical protein